MNDGFAKIAVGERAGDRELDRAYKRGEKLQADGRTAKRARYDPRTERVVIELNSGVAVAVPLHFIQGLAQATPASRRELKIAGGGVGLHWPRLDVDISVRNILAGVFGNRQWMSELARHAGSRTSAAKAKASRENGKKGGRPRKLAAQHARSTAQL
jgi:hypothetical protein